VLLKKSGDEMFLLLFVFFRKKVDQNFPFFILFTLFFSSKQTLRRRNRKKYRARETPRTINRSGE